MHSQYKKNKISLGTQDKHEFDLESKHKSEKGRTTFDIFWFQKNKKNIYDTHLEEYYFLFSTSFN